MAPSSGWFLYPCHRLCEDWSHNVLQCLSLRSWHNLKLMISLKLQNSLCLSG